MKLFSENRVVRFQNTDLLNMFRSSQQGLAGANLGGEVSTDTNLYNGSSVETASQGAPGLDSQEAPEVSSSQDAAQAELADALNKAGAEGLTAKDLISAGVTQKDAGSALDEMKGSEVLSPNPEIAGIQMSTRKGVFASIGEFMSGKFASAWAKVKSLFGR